MEKETDWGKASVKKPYEFFKGPDSSGTLGEFLKDRVTQAQWLIRFGAVYVNSKRGIDEMQEISNADIIRVHTSPKRYDLDRDDLRARVVYENNDYLIIDKPSGLPMHPTLDNLYENLISGFDRQLYVTHRLDVPTSGLVLVAKTKQYQTAFNQIILERKVKKLYEACVTGEVGVGELVHYMKKTVSAPKIVVKEKPDDMSEWQECRLFIHTIIQNRLSIELLTGRTHQIRAQLAFEGAPILGDEMYGGSKSPFFGLRSTSLSFKCPLTGDFKSFQT